MCKVICYTILFFTLLSTFIICENLAFAYEEKEVYMRTTAPFPKIFIASFSIEKKKGTTRFIPHASGFYLNYDGVPYGITARHVVQRRRVTKKGKIVWEKYTKPLFIRIHTEDEQVPIAKRHKEISILNKLNYETLYSFHSDSSVDIAIFPAFFLSNLGEIALALPYKFVQTDDLVMVGEDVHIFGFPGPYGFTEGKSVVRSGTVCYKIDKYHYLLDANTWPGDSGGMVVSKPYFGVPKDNLKSYQWQIGGKIIGLYIGRKSPQDFKEFNLPESLEAFRIIASSQAIVETIESDEFRAYHNKWKRLWVEIKKQQERERTTESKNKNST